ncbi:MAG: maleylacetoacetate isomerase [Hyphomicrobiales bacterium]|nr:maleylacetoacetate isomerase [Hyphomicrobiales bacterium]
MTMKLFGFWRSIATYRVRVALRLKGIAFEETSVDLLTGEQFAPAYAAINQAHAVPSLVDNDLTLTQSLAIMEYLEERYPTPALLPELLSDRAYVRALALGTIADTHPLLVPRVRKQLAERFGANAEASEDWARHWLSIGLVSFEKALARRPPSPFVMGNEPGLADICIMSHLVAAQLFHAPLHDAPHLEALRATCSKVDAFATSHPLKQPGAPAA